MSDSWRAKANSALKDIKEKAVEISQTAKAELKESGFTDKVAEAAERTKKFLDEKGVTEKVNQASDKVSEHFDVVAGAKQLQLVEEHLALQSTYNDVLAEKLEEALNRIEALEHQLAATKRGA